MTGRTVITFGTFDVLHVGHIRVLNRAAEHGDRLVVGVSSDALNFSKKGRNPVFSQDERLEIVSNLKTVDEGLGRSCLEPPSLRYPHGVCMINVRYTDCCAKFLTVASIPILIRNIPCALLHPSAVPGASGRVYCRSPRQCEFAMPTMHD